MNSANSVSFTNIAVIFFGLCALSNNSTLSLLLWETAAATSVSDSPSFTHREFFINCFVYCPSTSEKKVSTNVRTKSGEAVVIGGLFQQEEEVSEKRVPFLGKIPLIGFLFKKKVVSVAETEFVIYLVPFVEKAESEVLGEGENLERLKKKYGKIAS